MRLKEIYEGWRNKVVPPRALRDEIDRVGSYRARICNSCNFNSVRHNTIRPDRHCILCGCTISAKVKCLSCSCPHDPPFWRNEISEREEDIIENVSIE